MKNNILSRPLFFIGFKTFIWLVIQIETDNYSLLLGFAVRLNEMKTLNI